MATTFTAVVGILISVLLVVTLIGYQVAGIVGALAFR